MNIIQIRKKNKKNGNQKGTMEFKEFPNRFKK